MRKKKIVTIKEVSEEVFDKAKILQESQVKIDDFDKINNLNQEIDLLWKGITTNFNFHSIVI